jgi:hypothetical protein
MLALFASLALLASGCGDDDDGDAVNAAGGGGKAADEGSKDAGSTATRSDCARGCDATLEADCSQGPDTREICESDCERLRSGSCGSQYRTLMSCAEGEAIECSPAGLPVIPACDSEYDAFVDCIN